MDVTESLACLKVSWSEETDDFLLFNNNNNNSNSNK